MKTRDYQYNIALHLPCHLTQWSVSNTPQLYFLCPVPANSNQLKFTATDFVSNHEKVASSLDKDIARLEMAAAAGNATVPPARLGGNLVFTVAFLGAPQVMTQLDEA